MEVLQIDNVYSYLTSPNQEIKETLWNALRHRKKDYYYPAASQRGWDGYVEFFDKKTGRFLTGLLPEIEYALKYKFKVPYNIIDKREPFEFSHKGVDNQFLNKWPNTKQVTLYDYQVDLINQAAKYHRGIVKSPTGSGKTNVFIGIMRALPHGTPTLILTDTINLTLQNYNCLVDLGFKDVGVFYGKKQEFRTITCSTIQSVSKLVEKFNQIKVLIVDEVHTCVSKVPISIYRKLKWTPIRIGISATPFTDCKVQKYLVKGHFGALLKTTATESGELTTKALQGRGILSGSECYFIEIDEPQLPYDIWADAVKYGIELNDYLHKIVKKLCSKSKGRTLVLVERLNQGDTLANMIPGTFWIKGEDDPNIRQEVIDKLKYSDNVTVIASQKIISKGIDVRIHNLINAAGGKASHSIIQRMGRGLRTADDKNTLKYYDFLFNINDYLRDHSEERIKVLKKEGHSIKIIEAGEII